MKLNIIEYIDRHEIVHYVDADVRITSCHTKVFIQSGKNKTTVEMPRSGWPHVFAFSRLFRRLLRLDKCNVIPVGNPLSALLFIRDGYVYRYDLNSRAVRHALKLQNCRCVLHQSVAVIDGREIIFGEYGQNPERKTVPIYRSTDAGASWDIAFSFPPGSIRHVHGCYWDPFEEKIWIFTGDFAGECFVVVADREFKNVEWLGDGSQQWRAVSAFFEQETIHWAMDSQLETSYMITLDRKSRKISQGQSFPGPVWYIKKTTDGIYLVATACETGPGVLTDYAHVFASRDLLEWAPVGKFKHDGLPKGLFKFGVVGFADGMESSSSFHIFGEALKDLEGRVARCELVKAAT